jgi:predicted RNase H-like HicB family nuclease
MTYHVKATWDEEAQVWVASSDDVPGLATEADTIEGLLAKLRVMIPDLLDANGVTPAPPGEVPFQLTTERSEVIKLQAA